MEQWTQWKPIPHLAYKYYIDSIYDDHQGLKIILSEDHSEHNKLYVTFEDSVDFYVRTDETFAHLLINDLDKRYGTSFYGDWTFFTVTNSRYIKTLSQQSYGIADERDFKHFSFIAVDSLLEVIANYEPRFEFKKI